MKLWGCRQAIAAKSAAHAFAHKHSLFATIDFLEEGEKKNV